jgi:hypothetical protein
MTIKTNTFPKPGDAFIELEIVREGGVFEDECVLTCEPSMNHEEGAGAYLSVGEECIWLDANETRVLINALQYCIRNAE